MDIERILGDRQLFDKTIYTPLLDAIHELKKRREQFPRYDLGKLNFLWDDLFFVLFRHIATPNFETHRFISIGDALGYKSMICEYSENKFVGSNKEKRALGKMTFFHGTGKKSGLKTTSKTIIDFNSSNGRQMKDVQTLWHQNLIDFHHILLSNAYKNIKPEYFDASEWFQKNGPFAENYYDDLLKIFISGGILFENFLIQDAHEKDFIRNIFLPAFIKVYEETGHKPLIVALEPTSIEGDDFWYYYPNNLIDQIPSTIQ